MEVYLEGGSEFTAIVLDVSSGFDCHPVVLLPTEVLALIIPGLGHIVAFYFFIFG